MTINRKMAAVAGASVLALTLSACAQSQRGDDGGDGGGGGGGDTGSTASDATFTFGAAGAPKLFDPFYASDGETFRVTRQIFEGLLSFKPGTAKPAPGLATKWESSEDGKTWTFHLREGVKFQDGTDFNADAVCYNFERWYNQKGDAQNSAVSYYWNNNFGGFADGKKPSLYKSCTAKDEGTAVIKTTRVTSKFPTILGHAAYAISSPTALKKYDANNVKAQGSGFKYPAYATSHPVGTGPFTFVDYDDAGGTVTLERNEDYWGEKAKVKKIIFKIIPDETTRRQELEAGTIDGYDLPNPVDWASLKQDGNQVLLRPAFNILYIGLNATTNPALKDSKVRKALMLATNREQLVKTQLPEGAKVATQFFPDTVTGWNPDIKAYPYDPAKAKQLLKEAGHPNLSIELWYPTEVTRPYMPDPQRIFQAVSSDWKKAGINVKPVSKPWAGGYLDGTEQGKAAAYFLGWTGDYDSADNFIGTFFGATDNAFDTHNYPWGKKLSAELQAADSEPDADKREELTKEVSAKIMEDYLPGLPLSHSPPAIVVSGKVHGLVASPLTAEEFSTISISE
jgi:peptide/nickel transport system substrate-binding protein